MNATNDNGWEEVQHAAAQMFSVWVNGTELEWAKEAWNHLHAAGLASGETILEVTAAKIRLVTLARIYHEFCGVAWEENPETPVNDLAENLEINPTALGILVPKGKIEQVDCSIDYNLREAALIEVTDSQRREIFRCLKAAYGGDVQLYTRMYHTHPRWAEVSRDEDSDEERDEDTEGDEFEVNEGNSHALSYVMNGFQEG